MNVAEIRAQLEQELAWRIDEILFFQNLCAAIDDESQRERFRRALVLLLYANFEGFCKFSLSLYVSTINAEQIECSVANYAIAAASLGDVFASLRNVTSRAKEFKNDAPDDTKLHRFARDREFVERALDIMSRKVAIPDNVVDTESNLNPVVLRKNLYRLGLPHDQFLNLEPEIHHLLSLRNKIAHGETKQGLPFREYEQLRDSAFQVMNKTSSEITRALSEGWFYRDEARVNKQAQLA